MKSVRDHLRDLQSQASRLTETVLALDAVFAAEEARLDRHDQASRLEAVYRAVAEDLQRLREAEASASRDSSRMRMMSSLLGFAVTAIISKGGVLSAITDASLREPAARELPFGLIMVCIGPGGLPDDVGAVSISRLVRDSHLPQADTINRLRDHGYLLLSAGAFSALISRLAGDVREGRLHLPVSRDSLIDIDKPNRQILSPKIIALE